MKKDFVIKILFVEILVEDVEQIISLLCNGGIVVWLVWVISMEEIQVVLDELVLDIVLYDLVLVKLLLCDVVQQIEVYGWDFLLVVLVVQMDNQVVVDMFNVGVCGIVICSQFKQLLMVLQCEYEVLQMCCQVCLFEVVLCEFECCVDVLLDLFIDLIVFVYDGMYVCVNKVYLDMFGYEDFDDLLCLLVFDFISSSDVEEFKNLLCSYVCNEKVVQYIELQVCCFDGSSFLVIVEFVYVIFEGEFCLQIVFCCQQVDLQLVEQLQCDLVIGLYNCVCMLEFIDDVVIVVVKGIKGQSLLLVELDNWNGLIDSVGMGKVDELLVVFVNWVSGELGEDDVVGLLVEYMFGVVLCDCNDEVVKVWIVGLQQCIVGEIFDFGNQFIMVLISVGGSLFGEKNVNVELLFNQVSQVLCNVFSQGGGWVEVYDLVVCEKVDVECECYWLQLLQQVLVNDGFVFYYQYMISLQDVEGEYLEILLCMNGLQGEVLFGFFMLIVEQYGLSVVIDCWVLNKVIEILCVCDGQGIYIMFFVKFIVDLVQDVLLLFWLGEQICKVGFKNGQIVLEMIESKVVILLCFVQEFVIGWKKFGGCFVLEQFGLGFNLFQLFNYVDVDYFKIDCFYMVQLLQYLENQKKIVEICYQVCEMNCIIVVEWVEDVSSILLLFVCGVDFVQGNFLQELQWLVN